MLNVPYFEQLSDKDVEIAGLFDVFVEQKALDRSDIRPIIGMDDPYHYRDKVISPFVPDRRGRGKGSDGRFAAKGANGTKPGRKGVSSHGRKSAKTGILTGMYAAGTHRVIESDGCLLENPLAKKVVDAVRSIMLKHGMEPYDEDSGNGFMRHVVVRAGHGSGEVLVVLVTNSDEFPHSRSFCRELVKRVPEVTTVVQSVNMRQTNVVMGESFRTLYGPGFILDRLCGLSFRISPGAFYQVNSEQTEVLYDKAIELAGLSGDEVILDAYCGTGTIGLAAASKGASRLVGVDSSKSAISDARRNASHNGIDGALFFAEDATEFMQRMASCEEGLETLFGEGGEGKRGHSDLVLFMDPPRAGSTDDFLDAAARLAPSRIVYISCNPSTQVRDAHRLVKSGYRVSAVQPVDMFPHTPHIECIAVFERLPNPMLG